MGKSTISMAIFNSYVKLPEGMRLWFWGQEEGKDEEDEKKEDEEDREWLGGSWWWHVENPWELYKTPAAAIHSGSTMTIWGRIASRTSSTS